MTGVRKGVGETDVEKLPEEIVANIFPNLMKIQWKSQGNPSSINIKNITSHDQLIKATNKGENISQNKETFCTVNNKNDSWFIRNNSSQRKTEIFFQRNKKVENKKFYIQWKYPSKVIIRQTKAESLLPGDFHYKKILREERKQCQMEISIYTKE